MKRLFTLLLLFMASIAQARPFLAYDVEIGVVDCNVVVDNGPKITVLAVKEPTSLNASGLSCLFDLAPLIPGSHTATMTARSAADSIWGQQESVPSIPFSGTKPASPRAPSTPRLLP